MPAAIYYALLLLMFAAAIDIRCRLSAVTLARWLQWRERAIVARLPRVDADASILFVITTACFTMERALRALCVVTRYSLLRFCLPPMPPLAFSPRAAVGVATLPAEQE